MTSIKYPKVRYVGDFSLDGLLEGEVSVEEKLDGSQFSFVVIDGKLHMSSRRRELTSADKGLFDLAIATAEAKQDILTPGYIYRGEAFSSQKQNQLVYERMPKGGIMLFDITTGPAQWASRELKEQEAGRLGLELTPEIYRGHVESVEQIQTLMDRESILGGTKIEGVVIKNYKPAFKIGKVVSEYFQEVKKSGKSKDPKMGPIDKIVDQYKTESRWNKALQHLREADSLDYSPRDIGLLVREVQIDLLEECGEEIKALLMKHFWKHIGNGVTNGLAAWWNAKLLEQEFDSED